MIGPNLDSEIFFRLSATGLDFLGLTYDVTIDENGYMLRAVDLQTGSIAFIEHCGHTQDEVLANFKDEIKQAAIEFMLGYSERLDCDWTHKEQK